MQRVVEAGASDGSEDDGMEGVSDGSEDERMEGASDGSEDDRMEVDNTDDQRCRLTNGEDLMRADGKHFMRLDPQVWEKLRKGINVKVMRLFFERVRKLYWEGPPKMKEAAWDDTFFRILCYSFPSKWNIMLKVNKAWRDMLRYCPEAKRIAVHFRPSMRKMLPYKEVGGVFRRCTFWDAEKYQIVGTNFVSNSAPGIDLVYLVSLEELVADLRYKILVLDLRAFNILPPLQTIRAITLDSLNCLTELHLPLSQDLFGVDNRLWGIATYFQENHRPSAALRDIDGERAAAGNWVRKIFEIVHLCKHCTKVDISNRDLHDIGNESARPALVEGLQKCTQLRHVNISRHNLKTWASGITPLWWRTIVPVLIQNHNLHIYDNEWMWLWCEQRRKVIRIMFTTVGGDAWSYALQA